jgi:hypothetical protein
MTRVDLVPLLARLAPPDTLDEAVERVSEVCSGTMLGLVGCVFLDIHQLEKALWECKVKVEFQLICDSGPVQTWRGEASDPSGNMFEMWATASSERFLQVRDRLTGHGHRRGQAGPRDSERKGMTMKELKGNATVQMVLNHYTDCDPALAESLMVEFIESLGPKVQADFKKFVHDKAADEIDEEDLDEDADDEEEGEEELLEDEE